MKNRCFTHGLYESEINYKFVKAINYVFQNKKSIIDTDNEKLKTLEDDKELLKKRDKLINDINAIVSVDSISNKDESLISKQMELSDIEYKISVNKIKRTQIKEFINSLLKLKKQIKDFDATLLNTLIDKMFILKNGMVVRFKDGFELNV